MKCKTFVRLFLLGIGLFTAAAHADFPRPSIYEAIWDLAGFGCIKPPGWTSCITFSSRIAACYIANDDAVRGGSYPWDNMRVSDTPNPVGNYECYGRNLSVSYCREECTMAAAAEAWSTRAPLNIDRRALCEEVSERAERIRHHMQCRGKPADWAERLAIEQALETRGYLRKEMGGWC